MKSQFFAAAFVAASVLPVTASSAVAQNASTNVLLEAESSLVASPTVEAKIRYSSAKIEYGMVENDESIFGYEVELGWYGFTGGMDVCHDMTGINGRRGRYNEIESFLGYGFNFGDLAMTAAYAYKGIGVRGEPDTQEAELAFEYETPWVTPFLELVCDTHAKAGALYGQVGLSRTWDLCGRVKLLTCGGIGFGNPHHNVWCFDCDRWAFREIHLGAGLEIEICPHVKLVPGIDFYDAFTSDQRAAYDRHNGFIAVASCCLAIEF